MIKQTYYYYDVVLTFILRNNIQIQFEYKKVYKNKNNFFLLEKISLLSQTISFSSQIFIKKYVFQPKIKILLKK